MEQGALTWMTNHKRKLAAAALLASSFLFAGACPASAADAVTPIPAASGSLESLGTPVAGEDSLHDYIQNSFDAATAGVEVQFKYEPHETYEIYCQDGFVTDIKFQPGEKVTYVGAGDTTRWIIDRSSAGTGALRREHVYVKPIKRGLSTNLIINTNQRTYQIHAVSGSRYNPMVSWVVETSRELFRRQLEGREIENLMTVNAMNLHFDYKISERGLSWSPTAVFDDGQKTYLKMKPELRASVAPIFMIEDHGKTVLVNYRMVGGYYVVDRIFKDGKLLVGTTKIKIRRR